MADDPGFPSLDQLGILIAIVEQGSLAAAGRRLGRATSAISYGLANLEAQLGVALFTRAGTRRLQLTEAGQVVLGEARSLVHGVDGLRARVRALRGGLEAELSLAVDVMFPVDRLIAALTGFQHEFPTVPVRLHVEALGAVTQLLLAGTATLGISGPLHTDSDRLESHGLTGVMMVPVAAPGHPLATRTIVAGAAREHLQLVLTDRSVLSAGRDFGVLGVRTWRLADLGAKHALLRAGAGWGHMPAPMVAEDLASGRLVRLALPEMTEILYPLSLVHLASRPPGPAARWLIARLGADQPASAAA